MTDSYDVIVIGGGSAGENVAARIVAGGMSAALVERELLGGECSYWACMPSKALLRPIEALNAARRVPGAAGAVTGEVDVETTLKSRDAFISDLDDAAQMQWAQGAGVDVVRGVGRLTGQRLVEVERDGKTVELEARRAVVLSTGTVAAIPPVEGLQDVLAWDNREATTTKEIPERLLILGGGVVGVEMAQAFASLGASVTLIELFERLLVREEPFAGEQLADALRGNGVDVRVDTEAVKAERDGRDGPVTLTLSGGEVLVGDELLVATGRKPRTDDLGLSTVGLEPGSSVEVDDRLCATGVEGDWLYAVGDVNGRSLLTHSGKYQARQAADVILGLDASAWSDRTATPRVVFTDPQVAAVGLTESQARDQGLDFRIVSVDTGAVAGSALLGKGVSGTSQLIVDEARGVVVGATFTGAQVAELLHSATVAIVGEVPLTRLWHAIPSFPTVSEVWLRLLEEYGL